MEAPGNDGTIRLVFKLADGIEVNGWALDVIAKYKAAQNVITVGWETYGPNDLKTFALEGLVLYESVTVRQSSQGLKNEPAREVTVTAGGVPTDYYTKNGKLDSTVVRRAGKTDRDGRFVLNGLQAIDGDRISILVSNNGVVQVEYRYLTNQRATEQRVCEEQQANPSTKSNDVVSVTRDCVVLDVTSDRVAGEDAAPIRMPIITGYTPYVTDVRFFLDKRTTDGRNNTVPIYADDSVALQADVSIPPDGGPGHAREGRSSGGL